MRSAPNRRLVRFSNDHGPMRARLGKSITGNPGAFVIGRLRRKREWFTGCDHAAGCIVSWPDSASHPARMAHLAHRSVNSPDGNSGRPVERVSSGLRRKQKWFDNSVPGPFLAFLVLVAFASETKSDWCMSARPPASQRITKCRAL
jgi:hypothetical protein